jgi:peptidoglycan/LPS O-acetylase OafA/YrhL
MLIEKKIFKVFLGLLIATIALFSGVVFLNNVEFFITLGIIPDLFEGLFTLSYLYLVIGLVRLKKWALIAFSIIIGLALLITIMFVFTGQKEDAMEGFFYSVSAISMIVLPISALLAIARKIKKRLEK